jgi:hypothetical protein
MGVIRFIGWIGNRRYNGLDAFLHLGARKQHPAPTRQAAQTNIRANARDLPLKSTTWVFLFEANRITNDKLHRHSAASQRPIKADL